MADACAVFLCYFSHNLGIFISTRKWILLCYYQLSFRIPLDFTNLSTDVLFLLCGTQSSTAHCVWLQCYLREKATALSEGGKQAMPLFLSFGFVLFQHWSVYLSFTRSEVPISIYFQRSIQNSFLIFLLPSCQNAYPLKYSLVAKLFRRKTIQPIFCIFSILLRATASYPVSFLVRFQSKVSVAVV